MLRASLAALLKDEDEDSITACGGSLIESEFNRNKRSAQWAVASIDEELSKSLIWVTVPMRKLSALQRG